MFQSTGLTIFFSFGIAVFFLGVLPLWDRVSDMNAKITDTELLIGELQNLQQRKDQLVRIYNSVSDENIQKLESVIPATPASTDASALYLFLESVARESGLRVESISVLAEETAPAASAPARRAGIPVFQLPTNGETPQQTARAIPRRTGIIQETRVNIVVKGNYNSFKSFLSAIESNLRIIDVSTIIVAPSEKELLSFTLNLKTYHQ